MSSQRKLDSARANGAKSRGPVSPKKARPSLPKTASATGLLAQAVVLEGESKDRFEQLHASLIAEFQPRTAAENALVDTMTIVRWRHLRVLGIQKAGFNLEMARQPGPASPAQRAAAAFKNLADNSRVLDLLQRYETSYDRQFTRALNALLKLRAAPAKPSAGDASPFLTPPPTGVAEVEPATLQKMRRSRPLRSRLSRLSRSLQQSIRIFQTNPIPTSNTGVLQSLPPKSRSRRPITKAREEKSEPPRRYTSD